MEMVGPIDRLVPNTRSPRKKATALDRLVASIREFGIFGLSLGARSK